MKHCYAKHVIAIASLELFAKSSLAAIFVIMPPKTPLRNLVKPPPISKPTKFPAVARKTPQEPSLPSNPSPSANTEPLTARSARPSTRPSPPPPPPQKPRRLPGLQWLRNTSSNNQPPVHPPFGQHDSVRNPVLWASNVIVILCTMLWFRDHSFEIQTVIGPSMSPTLNPHYNETGEADSVFLIPYREWGMKPKEADDEEENDRYNRRNERNIIKRGDIVMYWKPHRPEEIGIKRVIGLEGDTIYPTRGYALDPLRLASRAQGVMDGLADDDPDSVQQVEVGKVVVPYGHIWVEGDNWRNSFDSNDFGPISKGLVLGKAMWVWRDWWSISTIGDLREKGKASRVVKGRAELPEVFLD